MDATNLATHKGHNVKVMRQVILRAGDVVVDETPPPEVSPGRVLVRTRASFISAGTELAGLKAQSDPLWKRALKNPDKVAVALRMMADRGVGATMQVVQGAQAAGIAVGYSASGKVIGIGDGVVGFSSGDRVACAGAGYAMHADYISVPQNLVVKVPDAVSLEAASTVTLGAIALQGVRRLQPTLGETFVVYGLGVLGQLAARLLRANGCRVIGLDLDEGRVRQSQDAVVDAAICSADSIPVDVIHRLTGGVGADGVVVTAASKDQTLLNTAFAMCRRKGRVVLIGDVPINIDRAAIYRNELEFLISTSYGPGRYDASFEEHGLDYPVGYVRWTETRNMEAYLGLLASQRVEVEPLIGTRFDIEEAPRAYRALVDRSERPLGVVLTYGGADTLPPQNRVLVKEQKALDGAIGIALVGTSSFARTVHLPNMDKLGSRYQLRAVCSSIGHQAAQLAQAQHANYATSNYMDVLSDENVDLVLVAGRHNEHARQALEGLKAGKHVFVEKPLALNADELKPIEAFVEQSGGNSPILMTGFNRRFAPAIAALKRELARRTGPMVISYRMNAGRIPHSHWTQQAEGGGRNIGEACHIYDLFTALTAARATRVRASAIGTENSEMSRNENFSMSVTFEDGSLASLVYTSLGGPSWPKERMEVYCDGSVFALDDYRSLTVAGSSKALWESKGQDKGHKVELEALADAIQSGGDWPIPLWQQIQATRVSFEVEAQIYDRASSGWGAH